MRSACDISHDVSISVQVKICPGASLWGSGTCDLNGLSRQDSRIRTDNRGNGQWGFCYKSPDEQMKYKQ